MSMRVHMGGTSYAATITRTATFGVGFYFGIGWIAQNYNIEILNPMPHRILAAAVCAALAELALRKLTDEEAMHDYNLRNSIKHLQSKIKNDEEGKYTASVVSEMVGHEVTPDLIKRNFQDATRKSVKSNRRAIKQNEELITELAKDLKAQGTTQEEWRTSVSALLSKVINGKDNLDADKDKDAGADNDADNDADKISADLEAELRNEIAKKDEMLAQLADRLDALEAAQVPPDKKGKKVTA